MKRSRGNDMHRTGRKDRKICINRSRYEAKDTLMKHNVQYTKKIPFSLNPTTQAE